MYIFPENLIKEFEAIAGKSISQEDGKLIETLAFVAGFKENDNYIGTHLIFPQQTGSGGHVEDKGKNFNVTRYILIHFDAFFCSIWNFDSVL